MEEYITVLKQIKSEILSSRYLIAKVANRELLNLYFKVGKVVSEKAASGKWGSGTIKNLSDDLQSELKGLRGFSPTNIKRMKQFYEAWEPYFLISPLPTNQLENNSDKTGIIEISPSPTDQLKLEKSSLMTNQFVEKFLLVSFTAHYEIL